MIPPVDYNKLLRVVLARFEPKRTDDLKDYVRPLVVTVSVFICVDYGSAEDDPYPGQYRWSSNDPAFDGRWSPDEDLVVLESRGRWTAQSPDGITARDGQPPCILAD